MEANDVNKIEDKVNEYLDKDKNEFKRQLLYMLKYDKEVRETVIKLVEEEIDIKDLAEKIQDSIDESNYQKSYY